MNGNRDLSELGESTLKAWAAQQGVTAEKAIPDKRGWDFVLEIPPHQESVSSSDTSIRCIVQVNPPTKETLPLP